jgi:ABC-type nitrate/sulfonate/bicarbonate transport system ATPase subunit
MYHSKEIILKVENLSVAYHGKTIIQNINIEEKDTVRDDRLQGQIIAVLGRSGRGKSTLFRSLTGLTPPTTGRVLIPDFSKEPVDGNQPAKKVREGDIGFVDQKYTLFRNKTVYQALQFAYRKSIDSADNKEARINQLLSEWGLEKVKNSYPFQLSGGQRQRTAILEQLLCAGHYLVLDEPFSGLDVGNVESVKKAFQLINTTHEKNTIIFSTHDIELAVELADSIYVIGFPPNEVDSGNSNIGTIVKHFDLKALNLAWKDSFTAEHLALAKEIKQVLLNS